MRALLIRSVVALVFGFVLGVIGLLVGTWFGGNFATGFEFNSVRGYEATGQVGFILFALAGLIAGWEFMEKRTKKLR